MKFTKKAQKFSLVSRLRSFKFAFKGVFLLFKNEHNAWIHALAAIVAISFGFYFKITQNEWIAVIFLIGFVFSAEAFNSAIEKLVDKISPEYNETAGNIKDLAAGAVLFAAIAAAIAGIVIFAPYFARLVN
jgi:diacylglycerol kinase (ATP)